MFCESYRKALSEAAASGERLPRELQLHLAGCGACDSAFTEEQRLFASIDSAMSAAVNVEVPASLLPRVRQRVAAVPERAPWREFLPVFASALVVACVFAVSFSHRRNPVPGPSKTPNVAVARVGSSSAEHAVVEPPVIAKSPVRSQSVKLRTGAIRERRLPSVEVLVSSDERNGFERYVSGLRDRTPFLFAGVAAKGDTEFKIPPLEINEIDVVQLAIEPLETGESN